MSRTFTLSARAEKDLDDILNYMLRKAGPSRTLAFNDKFERALELLAEHPGMGHRHEHLTDTFLRVWRVYSYLVFYRPDTAPLEIVRILHGARNPGELAIEE